MVVIIAAVLGVIVSFLAYFGVFQQEMTEVYQSSDPRTPGSWFDGAIAGFASLALGLLMVIVVAAVGFVIGKDLWVRVVAVAVAVCTIVGVAIAGGAGMLAASGAATRESDLFGSGAFNCVAFDAATPPEIQRAIDELQHPDTAEVYITGGDVCSAMLVGVSVDEAVTLYRAQLQDAGWTIEDAGDTALTARREGQTFLITSCGTQTLVVVHLSTAPERAWC
jgi:hypothetical protein